MYLMRDENKGQKMCKALQTDTANGVLLNYEFKWGCDRKTIIFYLVKKTTYTFTTILIYMPK